ncbi:hypothetical protein [Mucilaginibacter ginsenosidivorans]|uniref:Uncharacterized protein n=1 Tax=Mucilaginibacter ginsenosidivorans TaxID=398053 RepID=A0A5B8UU95_9SPHI|nr:hypothetical protein [Mucilaginibacter ginsenosidivorans]QEC62503.1 hypothetical protein FRZ54_07845 [Mucilaginibacter ginsenosidivorans]
MKTLILLLALYQGGGHFRPDSVYVCDSPGAKKYHLRADCRGLGNCQHRVVKITPAEAKKRGKTLCGWEK